MFKLITGKAGAGKTAKIFGEIKKAVEDGKSGSYLLVPELFSYEAQKELCRVCGDSLSLYAQVTSFTGLAYQLASELGGASLPYMDEAGRLLCMSLALRELQKSGALRYFKSNAHKSEISQLMLSALDEMKRSSITASELSTLSEMLEGNLADKITDLSSCAERFDELVAQTHLDPSDRMSVLAGQIERSSFSNSDSFYLDGFNGFTESEFRVIRALLKKGVNMTVCLTMDKFDDGSEFFALPNATARRLKQMALELNLEFVAERYFSEATEASREFHVCANIVEECEFAAVRTLELVKETNCRFRDIAVAVRGFDDYRSMLESTFDKFSIPLYTARKENLTSKTLAVFVSCAFDICQNGFPVDDVISLVGTGLTGLDERQSDILTEYIFKWNLREGHWRQENSWHQHPGGYGESYSDETYALLSEINGARRLIGTPLVAFSDACKSAVTVHDHALALAALFEDMHVSRHMDDTESQTWDVCITALEQMDAVLGPKSIETDEFCRLYLLMLSKYEVGTIPDSVDSVSAGDFDRMRRRHIRHLIVIGASDERLPSSRSEDGLFSADELEILAANKLEFGGCSDEKLFREFSLIYNCFSLPSDSLIFAYSGNPSYIIDQAGEAGKYIPVYPVELPAFDRGRLSENSVRLLYGNNLRINATRADRYYSCKYSYFCRYGLKANPYKSAQFDASEIGTFVHYVLEHVARECAEAGGFKNVSDDKLMSMTRDCIDTYIHENLNDFSEKSDRFVFLFKRIRNDVFSIVLDMASELRRSDFVPCEFELNFADPERFDSLKINDGKDSLVMSGIADRVDEWKQGDKRFVRIVDYKTGNKKFSLSDIWYGMGMQMLLYLYALAMSENGNVIPAGVMYVPASNRYVTLPAAPDDGEAEKKRMSDKRRSGIVLDSFGVPDAWENGEEKIYEPKSSQMSIHQFDLLSKLIAQRLGEMACGIRDGNIDADPCRKGSEGPACMYCDFRDSCGFSDGENGESFRKLKRLSSDAVWDRIEEVCDVSR